MPNREDKYRKYNKIKAEKAIELLAMGNLSVKEIAKRLNIGMSTIYDWKQLPEFMEKVLIRARELLKEELPKVYKQLGNNAGKGRLGYIKVLLDHLEKLEGARSNVAQISFTWKGPADEDHNE